MSRIKMEDIIEVHEDQYRRILKRTIDCVVPDNEFSGVELLRLFQAELRKEFDRWERIPDRCVEAD